MNDATAPTSPPRSHLATGLKLLVVIAALGWLVRSGKLNLEQFRFVPGCWRLLTAACGLYLAAMFISFCRYHLLLRAVGVSLRLTTVLRIGFIGGFFNLIMPGSLGGDVIKLAYVIKYSGKRAQAIASVMVDRVLGLLGLIAIAGIAIACSWRDVVANPDLHTLSLAVFGVLGAAGMAGTVGLVSLAKDRRIGLLAWSLLTLGALTFAAVALHGDRLRFIAVPGTSPAALLRGRALLVLLGVCLGGLGCVLVVPSCLPGRGLANLIETRLPLGRLLMRLVQSLLMYRSRFGTIIASMLLSVTLQGIVLLGIYVLGFALALTPHPSAMQVLYAAPPAQVANALPVSLGGLGVGEAAFDSLLRLASGGAVTGGAAVFLLLRVCITAISLVGLPLYLYRRREIDEVRRTGKNLD